MNNDNEETAIFGLVKDLRCRFALIETKPWTFKKGCMELIVQIGHLTQAWIFTNQNHPSNAFHEKGREIINIDDELVDCVFQVIALMMFIQFTEKKIIESIRSNAKQENENQGLLNLIIVSSQLLESAMRIDGDRFPYSRQPFYHSEYSFISLKLIETMSLLRYFADLRSIDIIFAFKKMYSDALGFLSQFRIQEQKQALDQYKSIKKSFNKNIFRG